MEHTVQGMANWQIITAVVIFLVCYAIIVSEKINRAIIAMCGAVLMILLKIVDFHKSYTEHIHWETIFLLVGMMIIVAIANKSGIFHYLAVKTAKSTGGNPKKILIRLALLTAIGSAFIDNVTMVLLIAPITIAITQSLRINPIPFLIAETMVCNIGGAATLTGDPPNIMIGTAVGISFNSFLIHITPIIIILVFISLLYLKIYFSKRLHVDELHQRKLMETEPMDYIRDLNLAKKSIVVFILTLAGFATQQFTGLEPAAVALLGAALLLLISAKTSDLDEVLRSVEWVTIFFFAGLFVLVGGLVDAGIIEKLAARVINVTHGDIVFTSFAILWGSGVASAFVDNIPLVATIIPLIQDMSAQLVLSPAELSTLWWSLVLGACLGGNGTLIASSANLIVASIAAREGTPISFIDFLKVSIPITLITLAFATVYVYFVYIRLGFA